MNQQLDNHEPAAGATDRLPSFQPLFIESRRGKLFALYFKPAFGARHLLYVPPFAEELNRTRPMVAIQARALAKRGIGVLVVDLHGTGDSDGDFGDATWEIWLADIDAAIAWLRGQGQECLGLWALRHGALLAAAALAARSAAFERLLLWQPVIDGQAALTQFLRIRMAAGMIATEAKETVKDLRAVLRQGQTLEVAGYSLNPALAEQLEAARLDRLPPTVNRVDWVEVTANAEATLSMASQKTISGLRAAGVAVTDHVVVGEAFWALHERTIVPSLIDTTTRLFEDG